MSLCANILNKKTLNQMSLWAKNISQYEQNFFLLKIIMRKAISVVCHKYPPPVEYHCGQQTLNQMSLSVNIESI